MPERLFSRVVKIRRRLHASSSRSRLARIAVVAALRGRQRGRRRGCALHRLRHTAPKTARNADRGKRLDYLDSNRHFVTMGLLSCLKAGSPYYGRAGDGVQRRLSRQSLHDALLPLVETKSRDGRCDNLHSSTSVEIKRWIALVETRVMRIFNFLEPLRLRCSGERTSRGLPQPIMARAPG